MKVFKYFFTSKKTDGHEKDLVSRYDLEGSRGSIQ